MKKSALSLLIIISVLLCSCTANPMQEFKDTEYNPETDVQYFYRMGDFEIPAVSTDNGYYYVGRHGIVIFVDKKTMKGTPLCNKPNCNHSDKDECNAYIKNSELGSGMGNVLQYYNEGLYYIGTRYDDSTNNTYSVLQRINLDGTSKVTVKEIHKEFIQWFIHRGYLYFVTDRGIYRSPVDDKSTDYETLFELKEYDKCTNNINTLSIYGDYVYFYAAAGKSNPKTNMSPPYHSYIMNLKNLKVKKSKQNGKNISVITFSDNKVIFLEENTDRREILTYYIANLDFKNPKELIKLPVGVNIACDGKYYYTSDARRLEDLSEEEVKERKNLKDCFGQTVTVYDKSLQKIDSFILPCKESYYEVFAQDKDNFLFNFTEKEYNEETCQETEVGFLYAIDKSKIGTFKGQIAKAEKICKTNWYKYIMPDYITVG